MTTQRSSAAQRPDVSWLMLLNDRDRVAREIADAKERLRRADIYLTELDAAIERIGADAAGRSALAAAEEAGT